MPLVPEKLNTRQEVRNAIASQFWDQPVHSIRSLDGMARTLACEPPPLGQTAASGLLRPQELLVTQASGLPVMPGFSSHKGGVVLDRVVAKVGGKQWWANLSGRAKAQQMWAAHRGGSKVGDALRDLNGYSLSARTRFALGRNASLNYIIEAPDANELHEIVKSKANRGSRRSRAAKHKPALKAQAFAKYQLPGHDLVGSTAWNQEYLDSAAKYSAVPMAMSLDLASKDRPDGIQYRVGVHQVSAPEVEGTHMHSSEEAAPSGAGQWRSSLHVQGAVAVEGEGHLWRPSRRSSNAPASPVSISEEPAESANSGPASEEASSYQQNSDNTAEQAQSFPESTAHTAVQTPSAGQGPSSSGSIAAEAAAATAGQSQNLAQPSTPAGSTAEEAVAPQPSADSLQHQQGHPQGAQPQAQVVHPAHRSSSASGQHDAAGSASSTSEAHSRSAQAPSSSARSEGDPEATSSTARSTEVQTSAAASHAQPSMTAPASGTATSATRRAWPLVRHKPGDGGSGVLIDKYSSVVSDSDTSEEEEVQQPARLLRNVNAKEIQSGISQAQENVVKLRRVVEAVTNGVQEGRAEHQHQRQLALSRKVRPVPYSPWLSQPFLKVNAAVGCLARMPLPQNAFRAIHHTSQSAASIRGAQQPLDRKSSRFGSELWTPYLRDTALRVFGSVGVTGQLGHFCRPVLDFTAGSVRLDFGLTSPHHVNSTAAASSYGNLSVFNPREDYLDAADPDQQSTSQPLSSTRFKNRAFALEGRGIWHALSASITQQVIGPVRARADFRYALDLPSSIPQDPDGKRSWHNILEAAGKTRPTLLETVYGLDVIIPGTSGVARAAVWYSPMRKEAMAEIKLF